ncbi:hypothetical protein HU751_023040 [Pseudomonas sp. BW13M1]|uniref:Uncharacterized protein n=1 Tax=Pseudomonas peradeniyensis TaxID=2745488 RepID=A0A923JZI1_9PSED|nr:hypothetical protein [Pseudomonas peradeniyensis]MBV4507711.1 hypothetical protein [Pseudomonas peradeniyensis]
MTIDKQKLKALAEAFPSDLDWDSNTQPFFNGPSGESLGGGSTGFYSVYGQPFTIDGEEYDGTEYVSICTREFAEFVCSARSAVLALLAENDALRKDAERYSWLRQKSLPLDGHDFLSTQEILDRRIDAAMAKECGQ